MDKETTTISAVALATPKPWLTMKELLQEKNSLAVLPKAGDILTGRVIEKAQNRVYLDLGSFKTGILYKSEIDTSSTNFQDIKKDEELTVKIIELENKNGFTEVSLSEVGLDKAWDEIRELKAKG